MRGQSGFTLTELLAVIFPISLVAAGAIGFFINHHRTYLQQDLAVSTEENLRAAMAIVTDSLRTAGCGVPASNLGHWITWVSGFDNDPVIIAEGGDAPDVVSMAACTPKPIARLSGTAAAGSTTLSLVSDYPGTNLASLLNLTDKSLILIGDGEHARVKAVTGTAIQIDTDPTSNGLQGVRRAFLTGTPITRIDVTTFQVETDPATGSKWLRLNKHRGSEDPAAEGITNLQVTAVVPGSRYQIELTAQSSAVDPIGGQMLTRRLASEVRLRN